jgi:rare lipoprotein A
MRLPRLLQSATVPVLIVIILFTVASCSKPGFGEKGYEFVGVASWYGKDFHGKRTASGEKFNMNKMTAAHKKLPLGTVVKVTRIDTGKTVKVTINDRGPYVKGRVIDLSRKAAKKLGMLKIGHARVKVRVVGFNKKYRKYLR